MKSVLTQKELSERWGVTVKALTDWRRQGILQPIKNLPVIRYGLEYIQEIEVTTLEKFSPLDRKRMEIEIEKLKKENERLMSIVSNVLSEASKLIPYIK
ncbi:histidine kinase [Clostridium chromiireducens]|uniref:Histidine kinase n=1 Tax=Clostridium chromiireducens TaxID=225345 RepID=A0A964RNS2_9CLOT|nr:histidine kinase [Clostridium chromiireducens]MVX64925.1 histidine kinase [Clostridium chromiireducens]